MKIVSFYCDFANTFDCITGIYTQIRQDMINLRRVHLDRFQRIQRLPGQLNILSDQTL
ncbi:hypothetical protein [uncultured Desulfobacter sp.]